MVRDTYKPLQPTALKKGSTCRHPREYTTIALDTPAIDVMTDFLRVPAVTIRPDATLSQATNLMISRSVRLLFVVDADDLIIGVITARDTMGERPIKLLRERGGKHGDLRVEDVMTPQSMLEALQISDVLRSEVGHILATLKQIGRQHALVVEWDPGTQRHEIRGMFSATAIGRQLGVPIQTFEVANTFAEIEAALAPI
jgi:CBS domain-containing protein